MDSSLDIGTVNFIIRPGTDYTVQHQYVKKVTKFCLQIFIKYTKGEIRNNPLSLK